MRNALIDRLRELGYVDARSMTLVDRSSITRYEELTAGAAELVALKPAVIVVYGGTATAAVRKETTTIPIVMITGTDPVKSGYVASLARPGGNITGVTAMSADLAAKQVQLLKAVAPRMHRLAIMINPLSKVEGLVLRNAQKSANELGLEAYAAEVRTPADFETAFAGMTQAKADGLFIVGSTMFQANRARIMELALEHRLPTMTVNSDYAEAGALVAYGTTFGTAFRKAADHVAKILKGVSPSEIPFEQATDLQLIVNLKTAHALGIKIPDPVLLRADRVIGER